MKVKQIYDLVNATVGEVTGKTDLVQEDLSNIVDVGKEIINSDNLDNYTKKLINHIGKVVFVNRIYKGNVPSVLMDKWEFGSILEKISGDLPTATESDTWKLEDGKEYSQDVFYQPKVSAKFFNSKTTFEIPLSFTSLQVKESFSNVTQLNAFVSMLQTNVENASTVKLDSLIMRTINNMIGETLTELPATDGVIDFTQSGVRAVNLLTEYNAVTGESLTVDKALTTPEFIRYATYVIGLHTDRISKISTLFNAGGKERFTPLSDLHVVLLSEFEKASTVYLKSDVKNQENVSLPKYETVPYWQGSGLKYDFNDTSRITVKTSSGVDIDVNGILGVMFDRNALGVSNLDKRVTTAYNAKAEFYTNFYKFDSGYFNDLNENFIVFFIK